MASKEHPHECGYNPFLKTKWSGIFLYPQREKTSPLDYREHDDRTKLYNRPKIATRARVTSTGKQIGYLGLRSCSITFYHTPVSTSTDPVPQLQEAFGRFVCGSVGKCC